MELRTNRLALAVIFHALVQTSTAIVSFPKIQPIVGFSDSCSTAYSKPVADCILNDFPAIGGTGSCSSNCQEALLSAQTYVQRACLGQQAAQNSLIGQLFIGDVVNYLCTNDNGVATTTAASSTDSTAAVSSTMVTATSQAASSLAQSASSASTTESGTATTEDSTTSTPESTSSSIAASIASATSTTLTTSTSAPSSSSAASSFSDSSSSSSSTTSTTTSSSHTSSAASSKSTSGTQGSGGNGGSGGGSPFDAPFNSGAGQFGTLNLQLPMICLVTILCLLLSG